MYIIRKYDMKFAGVAEWQTRLFKGQVGNRVGSTPTTRTNIVFFIKGIIMKRNLSFTFKIFYKDGTSALLNERASKPEFLYNDFDGLLPMQDFERLKSQNLNTKDILILASKLYKGFLKDFYKIE